MIIIDTVKSYKCTKGFSLVEAAVVFIMSGVVIAIGSQMITVQVHQARMEKTDDNVDLTKAAIEDFYGSHGRYPCPANRGLPRNDPQYGREQCRAEITTNCANPAAGVVCTQVESRDADSDGINDNVLIGGVPFRTIFGDTDDISSNTPFVENTAQDAFNMTLTYAVSEKMADPSNTIENPANTHLGAIKVLDENRIEMLDPPSSAHFIVVSHGDNMIGAFSREGNLNTPCVVGLTQDGIPVTEITQNFGGLPPERENCDDNDAIFIAGLRSEVDGANYYDDTVAYTTIALERHWAQSMASSQTNIYNTNLGNVGVGVVNPESKLHVKEDITAQANIGGERFCDPSDSDCLDPNIIAGTGIECPAGQVATGIEENHLICETVFLAPPTATCANDNEFLVGISNLGNIVCCAPNDIGCLRPKQ